MHGGRHGRAKSESWVGIGGDERAHGIQRCQQLVDLILVMGCRQRDAQPRLAGGYGWRADGSDQQPTLFQRERGRECRRQRGRVDVSARAVQQAFDLPGRAGDERVVATDRLAERRPSTWALRAAPVLRTEDTGAVHALRPRFVGVLDHQRGVLLRAHRRQCAQCLAQIEQREHCIARPVVATTRVRPVG